MDGFYFVVTFIGVFLCCEGRYFRPFPISSEPQSVFDAVERNTDLQYSDQAHGVTALRDVDLRSCYITNYDPEWSLDQDGKIAVMETVSPIIMRDEALFSQFIRRVGPIVGKLCRTSKVYVVRPTEISTDTDESSIFAAPPPPGQPVPHKIYFDSGEHVRPRPFRIPTKKPEFQEHFKEHEEFGVPTKKPEFSASGHGAHGQHAFPVQAGGSEHRPFLVPQPLQQGIPQLKHHGHGHFHKRSDNSQEVAVPVPMRQETPHLRQP